MVISNKKEYSVISYYLLQLVVVLINKEHVMPEIISRLPEFNNKLSSFIIQRELLFLVKFPLDLREKVESISNGCEEVLKANEWSSPGLDIIKLRSDFALLSSEAQQERVQEIFDKHNLSEMFSISSDLLLPETQIISSHSAPEYNTKAYQDLLMSLLSKIPQKSFLMLARVAGILNDDEREDEDKEEESRLCLQLLLSIPSGYEIKTPLEGDLTEMALLYYKHKHWDLLPFELAYQMNWMQNVEKKFWEKVPLVKKKYKHPHPGYYVLQMLRVAFLFMTGNPEDAMKVGQKFILKSETMLVSFIYTRQHVLFILGVMSMESMETQHAIKYMSESKRCSGCIFNLIDLVNQFQIN